MHTLAKLTEEPDRETGELCLSGNMALGTINAAVRLRTIPKRGAKSPTHCVEVMRSGRWHSFGVAWKQTPHGGGEEYYSCRLSHPMWLQREVLVSVFPPSEDADGGEWSMVWKPAPQRAPDPLAGDAVMY